MADIIGTMTASLKINLVMKTPVLGFRCWLAGKVCAVAAAILGGKVIIELDPQLTTRFGTDEPTVTCL